MEDVLDVYERPYDPLRPVVCMDEKPYQLLGEGKEPLPMKPGSDKKLDSEYVRNGTCSIFAMIEPLGGWHRVSVREHRTAVDWAEEIKEMVDSRPVSKLSNENWMHVSARKITKRRKLSGNSVPKMHESNSRHYTQSLVNAKCLQDTTLVGCLGHTVLFLLFYF